MKPMSLRIKLTFAFLAIALFSFALVGVFANFILGDQFESYAVDRLGRTLEGVVRQIAQIYARAGNAWDTMDLEDAGMDLLGEGLILRVEDAGGAVVWDAREHNNGMCMRMLENMARNMQSYRSGFEGGYVETRHPVEAGGKSAGTVYIGYYGPYFYSDADLQFLSGLNRLLLIAAGISLLACVLLGAYLAKLLAHPIADTIRATGRIAAGDYAGRIPQNSGTKEIVALTGSINSLAESLEEQARLRKRLTADVAHELRTPLATLQSHVEAMIDGVWEADAERLGSCREEILRLSKLVDELGALSRYDAEHLALDFERFDLAALARRVVTGFEAALRQKGVACELEGGDVYLFADRDKLGQVLVNLVSNALKFTPEGGRIGITVFGTHGEAAFTVWDTGAGIPEKDLPYIFERFYRADASRCRETGGSGIGLTIAEAIVKAHGGRIGVKSAVGRGSEFTVTLPADRPVSE
ncbi:MAG: Signal transduction histidine-protein kinase BaeS [Firmicutes bacterium ADurb.Bin248]|nr:MAG: Signal transduction histidine-protein kinase BaeS [Firmicutes bacterium ADurb.Bin248]